MARATEKAVKFVPELYVPWSRLSRFVGDGKPHTHL